MALAPHFIHQYFFCYKSIPFKLCFNVVFFYFLIQAGRQAENNLYLNFSKSQIFNLYTAIVSSLESVINSTEWNRESRLEA